MTQWNFKSSRLKLQRAIQHINDLKTCVYTFLDSERNILRIEKDIKTGHNCFKCGFTKPIPDEIPLIIGDAIHNLRTALDYIAFEIVNKSGLNVSNVHFPFDETREGLMATIESGKIKRAAPEICEMIIDRVKPYKAGNYPLWALNRLDRIDKHRLLIPTITVTEVPNVCVEGDSGIVMKNCRINLTGGNVFTAISNHGNFEIKSYGTPTFSILFNDIDGVFSGQQIGTTLNQLTVVVDSTISMFETA